MLLKINNVSKRFGGIQALKDVNLQVDRGEFVGLIGPNGSGKTTLINVVTGLYKPDTGKILFDGLDITSFPSYRLCRLGIARTFQIPQPFNNMSVLENVLIASEFCSSGDLAHVMEILEEIGLKDKANVLAEKLSLVEKRLLELARALAMKPKLLFVDEILAGLRESEINRVTRILSELNENGITIVWVEHRVHELTKFVRRLVVLHQGLVIADGEPHEVINNKLVVEAYLGKV